MSTQTENWAYSLSLIPFLPINKLLFNSKELKSSLLFQSITTFPSSLSYENVFHPGLCVNELTSLPPAFIGSKREIKKLKLVSMKADLLKRLPTLHNIS